MESNPALARFIVREFGVEGCRDFGFNVKEKRRQVSVYKRGSEQWNRRYQITE